MKTKTLAAPEPARTVQARSLRDQIAAVLQDAIVSGEYRPGQRLVEREFVKRFGVSSIPVREALQSLEMRGLVTKQPNRGCAVVNLTAAQQRMMCDLRMLVEPTVTEWAARNYSPVLHREPLTSRADRMLEAASGGDTAAFYREDIDLHRLVWDMSGNEFAVRALETVVGSLFAMGHMKNKTKKARNLRVEALAHQRLVKAIVRPDPKEARRCMLYLISRNYDEIATFSGGT